MSNAVLELDIRIEFNTDNKLHNAVKLITDLFDKNLFVVNVGIPFYDVAIYVNQHNDSIIQKEIINKLIEDLYSVLDKYYDIVRYLNINYLIKTESGNYFPVESETDFAAMRRI